MGWLQDIGWIRWVEVIGLVALFAFLVYAAWWSWFSDRPRGRRRCPECWYDLTHGPGMTCPECGFAARSERDLRRRRRRPWAGVLAIVGCTMIGVYLGERVMTIGWSSYLPTWSLVVAMPITDNTRGVVFRELDRRVRDDSLSDDAWLSILQRCATGDGAARPPSDEWQNKYGGFTRLGANRAATHDDPAWRADAEEILLTLPPRVDMTTRDDWPVGIGPTLDVRARTWWPAGVQCRITSRPNLPDARPVAHVLRDRSIQPRSYSVLLPALEPGSHDVTLDLTIEQRAGDDEPWRAVGEQAIEVPITVRGDLAERLTAAGGPDLDDAVGRAFDNGLVQYLDGSLPIRVRVNQQATAGDLFDRTAIAVRAEVRRNGEPGRHLDIWWRGGLAGAGNPLSWEVPMHDDEVLLPPATPGDVWTIHVRSMPELALRVDGVTHFWEGEVVVEVGVATRQTPAPPRGWLPETPER
jgi:hypothetical protein